MFTPDAYSRAVADYDRTWRLTDEVLYRLCRDHPGHTDSEDVHAKLLIIGRSYATGIERKIPSEGTPGSSVAQLARHLLANGAALEDIFTELGLIDEPLTSEKLRQIIGLHGRMVNLIRPIVRKQQSTRSFVSKYMHFHCPAVPIYDSYVSGVLPKLFRWQKNFMLFPLPPGADEDYAWYVLRFWQLHQAAQAAGVSPTVRYLDYYLLCVAEGGA